MGPFLERLLQFFLPSQCFCCKAFLEEGEKRVCADCLSKIRWILPPFCTVCGGPFVTPQVDSHPCGACLTKKRYFTMARAVGIYEGPLQEAIHRWKYEGKVGLTPLFGAWMAERLSDHWHPRSIDLILPVPVHKRRLRERGFNQALLLGRELSQRTGIPCKMNFLQKKRATPPQIQLSGEERERGIRNSFQVRRREELKGKTILLVDDVYTTGATVNECSRVLLASGARRVDVFTLAHAVR